MNAIDYDYIPRVDVMEDEPLIDEAQHMGFLVGHEVEATCEEWAEIEELATAIDEAAAAGLLESLFAECGL